METRMPDVRRIGRNDPCPCLSGHKFKKCCGTSVPFDADGNTFETHIPFTEDVPEVGVRDGYTIVKVQLPLGGADGHALVYAHGRAFRRLVDVATVAERMRGRGKAFFYATLSYGQFVLGDEAPSQEW